jgi:hypothetical protein
MMTVNAETPNGRCVLRSGVIRVFPHLFKIPNQVDVLANGTHKHGQERFNVCVFAREPANRRAAGTCARTLTSCVAIVSVKKLIL